MHVTFSASGTPVQVDRSIYDQAKSARRSHPDSAAAINALRDDVAKHLAGAGPEDSVSVSVSASVSVTITKAAAPAPEPANHE